MFLSIISRHLLTNMQKQRRNQGLPENEREGIPAIILSAGTGAGKSKLLENFSVFTCIFSSYGSPPCGAVNYQTKLEQCVAWLEEMEQMRDGWTPDHWKMGDGHTATLADIKADRFPGVIPVKIVC